MKVKYIQQRYNEELDEKVNTWLDENKSIDIIDIKFSGIGGDNKRVGVLIIYNEGGKK